MFKKNVFDVNRDVRYTVTRTSKAVYDKKIDCNGKNYFMIKFYCKTNKGNIVEFFERRFDEDGAKKKVYSLNNGNKELKVQIECAEEVTSDDNTRRLLYGHALTKNYFKY